MANDSARLLYTKCPSISNNPKLVTILPIIFQIVHNPPTQHGHPTGSFIIYLSHLPIDAVAVV